MSLEQRVEQTADGIEWNRFPRRTHTVIQSFFFDPDGNLVASEELLRSVAEASKILPERRILPPSRISQGLNEQADMWRSQGKLDLESQLRKIADAL